MAIDQALQILNWHANLPKDERPPEYLWDDAKGLELWWQRVEAARSDGVSTSAFNRSSESDSGSSGAAPQVVENDLARMLKQG